MSLIADSIVIEQQIDQQCVVDEPVGAVPLRARARQIGARRP
jgi:hypothetical protein